MRTLRLPVLAVTVIALSATHAAAQKVDRAAVQTQVIAAEKQPSGHYAVECRPT